MRLLICLAALLASCTQSSSWPSSGIYSGYYTYGFEVSRFVPKGTKEKWWLSGKVPCQPQYTKETVARAPRVTPMLYIEVRGTLSPEGHHGHLGAYSRELIAQEVLVCRWLSPGETPGS
jgi:hypothetical protein